MTAYSRWEIVLVRFPFTDLKSTKKRPVLIVSPDEYNRHRDVVAAFITSNLKAAPRVGDYKLSGWREANLPKPSMMRMKFATIDKSIIIKKIGNLAGKDIEQVKKVLGRFFTGGE